MAAPIIVTGGAGFIGSNLVDALNARGHDDVVVVDHVEGDPGKLRNLERLQIGEYLDKREFRARVRAGKAPKASAVFHLGACSSTTETDEGYLRDNNTEYTREVCEWSLAGGARFVYASSAATYGDGSLGYSDEDAVTPTLKPLNLYGASKQWFDEWALRNGVLKRVAGIKYFNVYGPYEDHKGDMRSLVNKAYAQVMREGEIALFKSYRPAFKDGEQRRDFIHVDDAVAVTLFFLDRPEVSGLFNCGTGSARTWVDLAKALFSAVGLPPRIRFIDMPESIREKYQYHTQADMTKLRAAGYSAPFLQVEDGVRRYVQEYLQPQSAH
ncbi:MAG TPA: ADP-glyceromanno-heptose 6-epimerase [Candidatus Krumholzibacteria bacterium]|nr:ADP-glyceromanno-heptose 6-epimerase [Candidatus Krumholzibacteria bacterium]